MSRKSKHDFIEELKSEARFQADLAEDYLLPRTFEKVGLFFFDNSLLFLFLSSLSLALITTFFIS